MLGRDRIRRARGGEVKLRLPIEERELLRSLPGQLRQLFGTDDPSLRRLFPPAYVADEHAEHEAEYQRYMGGDLQDRHIRALDVMEKTVDADTLTDEEAGEWLAALNELRLVLGTRLDVSEETFDHELEADDPAAPGLALYSYLSWLQEQLVDALSRD